jgi:hypothetical protein
MKEEDSQRLAEKRRWIEWSDILVAVWEWEVR